MLWPIWWPIYIYLNSFILLFYATCFKRFAARKILFVAATSEISTYQTLVSSGCQNQNHVPILHAMDVLWSIKQKFSNKSGTLVKNKFSNFQIFKSLNFICYSYISANQCGQWVAGLMWLSKDEGMYIFLV